MTKDLTNGPPFKILFFFALPMLVGNIFQQLYNFADSAIVGKMLGENALAAVGGTFPISFLQLGIASGAGIGCSIIVSRYFAVKDKRIKTSIFTLIIIVSLIGIIMFILSMVFLKKFLTFLDTPENVYNDSYNYIKIVLLGTMCIYIYNALTSVFYAVGDTKTPLKFLITSTILNIIMDIILIGIFKMGIEGAAIATLTSQSFSCIGMIIYFIKVLPSMGFEKTNKYFDRKIAKDMIFIALPSIIQQNVVAIGMIAVQGLVNKFGSEFMAGYSASTKIDSVFTMLIINTSVALSTFIAQNMGAKKTDRIARGTKVACYMMLTVAIAATIFLQLFGKYALYIFLDDSSVNAINYGMQFFRYVSPFYIMLAFMFTSNGFLRGLGKMRVFTATTILNIFLRIVIAYSILPLAEYRCIFIGLASGWTVTAIIGMIYMNKSSWKQWVLNH